MSVRIDPRRSGFSRDDVEGARSRFAAEAAPAGGTTGDGLVREETGFSLIELLVVLVLLSAVVAISMPAFSNSTQSLKAREAARQIYGLLRTARSEAITWSKSTVVVIDENTREVAVMDARDRYVVPAGLQLALDIEAAHTGRVTFYPDGSASGTRFALLSSNRRFRFDVEPLSGRIRFDAQVLQSGSAL